MNVVLLDIFFGDKQNAEFLKEGNGNFRYLYLGDHTEIFENVFYPYLEKLSERQQLRTLSEKLSPENREVLLKIPEQFLQLITVEIISLDDTNEIHNKVLEVKCFVRIVKSYKHPAFFELLSYQ